jgi:hypothetical protein
MQRISQCPVCLNKFGGQCAEYPSRFDARDLKCDVCGMYRASRTVLDDNNDFRGTALTQLERAALSHALQIAQTGSTEDVPFIKSDWLREFRNNPYLPTPPARARRLLILIGERVQKFGHKLSTLQPSDISRVGFFDHQNLEAIFRELQTQGLVVGKMGVDASGSFHHPIDMDLTLKGWEEFEKLKSGSKGGTYAFLALKFNDPELEAFVSAVLKPSVEPRRVCRRPFSLREWPYDRQEAETSLLA